MPSATSTKLTVEAKPGKMTRAMRAGLLASVLAAVAVSSAHAASRPVHTVSAVLTTRAVVPRSTASGSGRIVIKLDAKAGTACWTITVRGLNGLLSAHVHKGRPGSTGRVVIPLGATFAKKGCVTVPGSSLKAVAASPSRYYVDVHTRKSPNGAVRGQLRAGG
jgi:hypothetical protein